MPSKVPMLSRVTRCWVNFTPRAIHGRNSSRRFSKSMTVTFPAGTFTGGTQTLATLLRNTWAESCHSFVYGNDAIPAAGTYDARVTYTLATP